MLWRLSLCCSLGDDCMVVDSGPPDTECWLFWVECGFWMFAACVCCMRHRDRCLRSIRLCGINCVWNLMRLRQFKVFLGVFWSAQWVLVWQTKAEDKVAENVSLYPNFPLAQRCPYCVVRFCVKPNVAGVRWNLSKWDVYSSQNLCYLKPKRHFPLSAYIEPFTTFFHWGVSPCCSSGTCALLIKAIGTYVTKILIMIDPCLVKTKKNLLLLSFRSDRVRYYQNLISQY